MDTLPHRCPLWPHQHAHMHILADARFAPRVAPAPKEHGHAQRARARLRRARRGGAAPAMPPPISRQRRPLSSTRRRPCSPPRPARPRHAPRGDPQSEGRTVRERDGARVAEGARCGRPSVGSQ
eukprot:641585-Prymnesium_polylepis.1